MKIKPSKREVKSFRNKYPALTIISLLFFGISQAQYIKPNNSYGTISNRQSIDSTLLIPTGCGDPSLRGVDLKKVALYADTCNNLLYKYNPVTTTWSVIGSNTTLADGRVSGGIVTWSGQGLKFYVAPTTYIIGGKYYYSNLDSVTLAAAPTSYSRIDLIGVDTSRHAFVDTGVVSATPIVPQAQVGVQIPLTTGILINAGDTIPSNVITTTVYNENLQQPSEWDTARQGSPMVLDFNNTDRPQSGTKDIYLSSYQYGNPYFVTSTPYLATSNATLSGWIYLKGKITGNVYALLYNQTSGAITNWIALPINKTDSNQYQPFVIQLSAFNWTGNVDNKFNVVEFMFSGTSTSGLYMDNIQLQKGIQSVPPQIDYSNKLDSVFLSNDSLFQYVKGVKTFRGLATGSGGSGGISKLGTSPYGLITVNDSTYKADSSLLLTKLMAAATYLTPSNANATYLKISDTTNKWIPKGSVFPTYVTKPILALNDSTLAFDSLNLTELRYSLAARDTTTWKDSTLIDRKYFNDRLASYTPGTTTDTTSLSNRIDSNAANIATNTTAIAGKLSNITGLVTQGTNVTVTGSGTSDSPYVINSSGGSGGSATGVDSTNIATSAGQTVFTFPYTLTSYTVQKIVTRNGVTINPADYTVNTGNITFTGFTCDSGDKIRFVGIK